MNKLCKVDKALGYLRNSCRVSKEAYKIVEHLLSKDPHQRPTPETALANHWFSKDFLPLQSSIRMNRFLTSNRRANLAQSIVCKDQKLMDFAKKSQNSHYNRKNEMMRSEDMRIL